MPQLRPELGPLPPRLRRLPIDDRGYVVPWFVAWNGGQPEFRAMDVQKFARACREKRCWVCGDILGVHMTFVVGPMCGVNRTSSEPPCHHECAEWSAKNCPFLSRPHMVRREDEVVNSAMASSASLMRNPGVTLLWTTRSFELFKAPGMSSTGYLITMGEPTKVEFFTEGRPATRAEILASVEGGLPELERMCETEETPRARLDAHQELARARHAFERLLPER